MWSPCLLSNVIYCIIFSLYWIFPKSISLGGLSPIILHSWKVEQEKLWIQGHPEPHSKTCLKNQNKIKQKIRHSPYSLINIYWYMCLYVFAHGGMVLGIKWATFPTDFSNFFILRQSLTKSRCCPGWAWICCLSARVPGLQVGTARPGEQHFFCSSGFFFF